jgi:hypothetical protein
MKKLISIIIVLALLGLFFFRYYNKPEPVAPITEKTGPIEIKAPPPIQKFYRVVEKELIPGKLVPTGKINKMSNTPEMNRINPVFFITFDTHDGRKKVEVTERAFNSVRRGEEYNEVQFLKFVK